VVGNSDDVLDGPVSIVELVDATEGPCHGYHWEFRLRHMITVVWRDDGTSNWLTDESYAPFIEPAYHPYDEPAPGLFDIRWEAVAPPVTVVIRANGLSLETATEAAPRVVRQLAAWKYLPPTLDQRARHQLARVMRYRELAARAGKSAIDRVATHGDGITADTVALIADAWPKLTGPVNVRGEFGDTVPEFGRRVLGLPAEGPVTVETDPAVWS